MFSYCDYFSNAKSVHFEVVNFSDRVVFDRKQRESEIQAYAQKFADELSAQCQKAPYQWFNFYDFWADQKVA